MQAFLSLLLAPAIVSLVVSLWAGRVMEAKRARRDNITKFFEITREDIRRAVEVAIEYFATPLKERSALQEAKVILADREIRSAMPVILGPHPELVNNDRAEAERRYQDLIAELTGGNFQAGEDEFDVEHIRRLTLAGAALRSSLARMRDAELKLLAGDDWVQKRWQSVREGLARTQNYLNS